MLKPYQCRAARAFLQWSQVRLAAEANLAESTVRDFEAERRAPRSDNLEAIETVLEQNGIEFIKGGVRWREGMNGHAVQIAQNDLRQGKQD
jgi:transcriptional regulator with XRE-family HTH domain